MPRRVLTNHDIADGAVRAAFTEFVPRPLAWVATVSPDGRPRLAAQSFVTLVSVDPPRVGVTVFGEQQTLTNIEATRGFVVSVATAESVRRAAATVGGRHPDVEEFTAGVPLEDAETGGLRRPADSPVHLECSLHTVLNFGNGHLVIGRLTALVVDDDPALDGRDGSFAVLGG